MILTKVSGASYYKLDETTTFTSVPDRVKNRKEEVLQEVCALIDMETEDEIYFNDGFKIRREERHGLAHSEHRTTYRIYKKGWIFYKEYAVIQIEWTNEWKRYIDFWVLEYNG